MQSSWIMRRVLLCRAVGSLAARLPFVYFPPAFPLHLHSLAFGCFLSPVTGRGAEGKITGRASPRISPWHLPPHTLCISGTHRFALQPCFPNINTLRRRLLGPKGRNPSEQWLSRGEYQTLGSVSYAGSFQCSLTQTRSSRRRKRLFRMKSAELPPCRFHGISHGERGLWPVFWGACTARRDCAEGRP